jgi:hypothetical protein
MTIIVKDASTLEDTIKITYKKENLEEELILISGEITSLEKRKADIEAKLELFK